MTNKNSLNTRKWGNIYFLFPASNPLLVLAVSSLFLLSLCSPNRNEVIASSLALFFSLTLVQIEYKYWFNKKIGISFYTCFTPFFIFYFKEALNFAISINLLWYKKNKNIFASDIIPVDFGLVNMGADNNKSNNKKEEPKKEKTLIHRFSSIFQLLKYEKDWKFYLIYGTFQINWGYLYNCELFDLFKTFMQGFLSIEFGLNIIGVNDYRKKKKMAKKLL